jgi:Domain of unknown function (DUF4134)
MLTLITWKEFIEGTLIIAGLYYLVIAALYYRKEVKAFLFKRIKPEVIGAFIECGLLIALYATARAQTADGNNGINQANTLVRGYFDSGTNLMYAVGAVLGLIGAVKVYQKWSHGDHDTGKVAAAWFGACIFLVVVATVIKSFFGL